MSILGLQLETHDVSQGKAFYADRLGLPVHHQTERELSVQIGPSRLSFVQTEGNQRPAYYFSVGLPQAHFSDAVAWIEARTNALNTSGGNNRAYTSDPLGNLIRFMPQNTPAPGNLPLVNICGIGMAVEQPRDIVSYLQAYLENREALVEEANTLVLRHDGIEFTFVKRGTPWLAGRSSAEIFPMIMSVASTINGTAKLLDYPYYVYRAATF